MESNNYRPACPRPQRPERPVAMVYGENQRLHSVYETEQAIRNGTLFPELNKPMYEKSMPIDRGNPSAKQAADFAAWETRLYLDTHPDDHQALKMFRRYCEMTGDPSYACTFVTTADQSVAAPCCACPQPVTGWSWLDDPWPWEHQGCQGTGGDSNVCL